MTLRRVAPAMVLCVLACLPPQAAPDAGTVDAGTADAGTADAGLFTQCRARAPEPGDTDESDEGEDLLAHSTFGETFLVRSDGGVATLLPRGNQYPVWVDGKRKVATQFSSTISEYRYPEMSLENTIEGSPPTGGIFLNYSPCIGDYMFTINSFGNGVALVGDAGVITALLGRPAIFSPASSGTDDWIYFLDSAGGVNNIHRAKRDGSREEVLTQETIFSYGNISVSYDGQYLVAAKSTASVRYLAIITIATRAERLIDVTVPSAGYPSFSRHNKYIYFTGTDAQQVFRLRFDGTELKQVTSHPASFYRTRAW